MTPAASAAPDPPLAVSAGRALRRLAALSGAASLAELRGADLLQERARLLGLAFRDRVAPGGACRLLDAADGSIAVSLPRDSDWALLPAWLELTPDAVDCWEALALRVRQRSAAALQDRGRLLGLAVAAVTPPAAVPPPFRRIVGPPLPEAPGPRPVRPPRVVDLSSLWAGPLCTHLLQQCGAEVIKVESVERPDGARSGHRTFFELLNQGKRSVALELGNAEGRRALGRLICTADIVVEASRPRALVQLGIDAAQMLRERPALTWISITGYGRDEPQAQWVAFGDDAGAAAGLCEVMRTVSGALQFAGDAVADPVTGIRAALAAWQSWQHGGGRVIALALAEVAAASFADELGELGTDTLQRRWGAWWSAVRGRRLEAGRGRPVTAPAPPLGADTEATLAALGC